jgi:VanZ family protein
MALEKGLPVQTLLKAWGPAAFWAAVLFLLSEAQPDSTSMWLSVNDKVAHLGLYTIMGAALAWGERCVGRKLPFLLILLGVSYGALDEWHQSFVPGRTPSLGDVLADTAGVILGFFLLRLYFQARSRSLSE